LIAALLSGVGWWQLAFLAAQPLPNPHLGPDEVIRTVVEALQHHNSPAPNAGIFTVYQFASPANRQNTSPYGKFLRLVRLPDFAPLLAHGVATYGPLAISGDRAEQEITVRMDVGREARFRFVVSRQTSRQTQGRCTGCWMVDQVVPLH
jgi:hypothetical protein